MTIEFSPILSGPHMIVYQGKGKTQIGTLYMTQGDGQWYFNDGQKEEPLGDDLEHAKAWINQEYGG